LYTPRNLKLFVTPLYNPNNLKFHFEFDTELILLISKFLLIQKNIMKKGKTSELSKKKELETALFLVYIKRMICLKQKNGKRRRG